MKEPKIYVPRFRLRPPIDVCGTFPPSSWAGLEWVLPEILNRFVPKCGLAVEFGVEYGFSTAALSCYFSLVIGVDPLLQPNGFAERTFERLNPYGNIKISREGWLSWAGEHDDCRPDVMHVDIDPHDYPMTYAAGTWAAEHCDCVLFHDSENPNADVKRAVGDIAEQQGMEFWNYPEHFGLGILVREK